MVKSPERVTDPRLSWRVTDSRSRGRIAGLLQPTSATAPLGALYGHGVFALKRCCPERCWCHTAMTCEAVMAAALPVVMVVVVAVVRSWHPARKSSRPQIESHPFGCSLCVFRPTVQGRPTQTLRTGVGKPPWTKGMKRSWWRVGRWQSSYREILNHQARDAAIGIVLIWASMIAVSDRDKGR